MHKRTTLIIFILFASSFFLFPGERIDFYLKAVSEKDPGQKVLLLKEFIAKYGQEQDKYVNYAYTQLTEATYQVKQYDETIVYGEKSLESADIAESSKLHVLNLLANAYQVSGKDLEKASKYAEAMIELSRAVIEKTNQANLDADKRQVFIDTQKKYYIAGGYRIQSLVFFENSKSNPALLNDAAVKAMEAYKNDASETNHRLVLLLANELYKKNQITAAITAVESVTDESKLDEKTSGFLAGLHYKAGNKEKAVFYYEKAYQARQKVETALKIGKLVYKQDIDKGIQYFADAFVMSKLDKNSDAFKYLQELYYNRKAKGLPGAEQEKGFQQIIQASQVRLDTVPAESKPN